MYTFYLASSTNYGVLMAQSLLDAGFTCSGILTPTPRPIGRHQCLTPNPADTFATTHSFPVFHLEKSIPATLQSELKPVDFLLVVDFGYYVPGWLIELPRQLAVNVHPSALPAWRGASPGQYAILSGNPHTAVSLITLAREMDAGDLLAQIPFTIAPTWTAQDYYDHAFTLAAQALPGILTAFAQDHLTLAPQIGTPTFAPKISKDDAFIPWEQIDNPEYATHIDAAIRAYTPWPHAWTQVNTAHGLKRLQLLSAHLKNSRLIIDTAKLEGRPTQTWSDIQKGIL